MGSEEREQPGRLHLFWRLSARAQAGRAQGLLRVWPLWERLARCIWPTVPIPGAPYHVFAVHFTHHRGDGIDLADGTVVCRGDRVVELHFNNEIVAQQVSRRLYQLWEATRGDLEALAAWLEHIDPEVDIKALYGVTLLAAGARRLGFTTHQRPYTLQTRLDRFFLTGLLALYSSQGIQRLTRGSTYGSYPQEVWMSRAELRRRYGASASRG